WTITPACRACPAGRRSSTSGEGHPGGRVRVHDACRPVHLEGRVVCWADRFARPESGFAYRVRRLTYPGSRFAYPEGRLTHPNGRLAYAEGRLTHPEGQLTYPDGQLTYSDSQLTHLDGQLVELVDWCSGGWCGGRSVSRCADHRGRGEGGVVRTWERGRFPDPSPTATALCASVSRAGSPRSVRPLRRPRRRGPWLPRPPSGCGPARGSAACRPATSCPRRPARPRTRRTA
ncbi:MAG: hypothetical protein QOI78_3963, partial [Actinomycetota bacterium]|nr:hypothetical protein [Actinomycetota bacterium]